MCCYISDLTASDGFYLTASGHVIKAVLGEHTSDLCAYLSLQNKAKVGILLRQWCGFYLLTDYFVCGWREGGTNTLPIYNPLF